MDLWKRFFQADDDGCCCCGGGDEDDGFDIMEDIDEDLWEETEIELVNDEGDVIKAHLYDIFYFEEDEYYVLAYDIPDEEDEYHWEIMKVDGDDLLPLEEEEEDRIYEAYEAMLEADESDDGDE